MVGYQQKETVPGFNFVIPTFAAIGDGGVNIQDIKIANATDWSDSIQILDDGGATIASYFYVDGWLSEDFSELADVTIEPGQGILIDTADVAGLTFAGQVATDDTVIETVPGFNFTGNNTPLPINIQDIKIVNATDWNDSIQILDDGGATIASYFYVDGWLSEDFSELADVTIEPGQGILIDTADVAEVTIPGVGEL